MTKFAIIVLLVLVCGLAHVIKTEVKDEDLKQYTLLAEIIAIFVGTISLAL